MRVLSEKCDTNTVSAEYGQPPCPVAGDGNVYVNNTLASLDTFSKDLPHFTINTPHIGFTNFPLRLISSTREKS